MEYKTVILDGAMGTMIQNAGIPVPEVPEILNITHPETLQAIHSAYEKAGSQIVYANTFGASPLKLKDTPYTAEQIVTAAISNARTGAPSCRVALDIGPLGQLMEPMGTFTFEEAYEQFASIVRAAKDADLIVIETMSDLLETKAAVLAAKENSTLPVFVTMSFEENGRTFTGCTLESMAATLEGLGADAIGLNCSIGPDGMIPLVKRLASLTNLPLIAKPNAGLPDPSTGKYAMDAEHFARFMDRLVQAGASYIGGCCGTDPDFIKAVSTWKGRPVIRTDAEKKSVVCTPLNALVLDEGIYPIGERINPTGKKRFQQALLEEDLDYIVSLAIEQKEAGACILDINVGYPGVDEPALMKKVVKKLQSVVDIPLLLDSSDPCALEAGARVYNGKPALNSVSAEQDKMDALFPIAKKYGASMVALTLDENGIPDTANERVVLAHRIMKEAARYGIAKASLWFDTLTLTLSAQPEQARQTLDAIRMLSQEGCRTVLGVSNISFGLPDRPAVTRVFLSQALYAGLTLPIINVNVEVYMDVVACARLISGQDPKASAYIERFSGRSEKKPDHASSMTLEEAIIKGLDHEAGVLAEQKLATTDPLALVETILIPALDTVGSAYEKGTMFLPQLLSSAQSAQAVFEVIKTHMARSGQQRLAKGTIVLATVKGDIHDIGKNIVKTVLENYGYDVIDLGKDVAPERVVDTVRKHKVRLVGLSALMTTTLPAMEETIRQLKELDEAPKIMVGGAVLTPEYAKQMHADYYSKDANDGVRIAREVFGDE